MLNQLKNKENRHGKATGKLGFTKISPNDTIFLATKLAKLRFDFDTMNSIKSS